MAADGGYVENHPNKLKITPALAHESGNKAHGAANSNKFANDGSFLELFRKQMNEQKTETLPVVERLSKSGGNKNRHASGSAASSLDSIDQPSAPNDIDNDQSNNIRTEQKKTVSEKLHMSGSSSTNDTSNQQKKALQFPFVGKRRGAAPVLKTGAVKKVKKDTQDEENMKNDPWSNYLAEVKKYKEKSCQDEDKTRPLVK